MLVMHKKKILINILYYILNVLVKLMSKYRQINIRVYKIDSKKITIIQ